MKNIQQRVSKTLFCYFYIMVVFLAAWCQLALCAEHTLQQKITPTESDVIEFGLSVAIYEDMLAVGTVEGGGSYVFERAGGLWEQTLNLRGAVDDCYSVAVSGNYLIVGMPTFGGGSYPDYTAWRGETYIKYKSGGEWESWFHYLNNNYYSGLILDEYVEYDQFGSSVAIYGDTLVVGTPGDNLNTGAAYVFDRRSDNSVGNRFLCVAKLTAAGGVQEDSLGSSVAISGNTVVVGAPGAYNKNGAAYVFVKPANGWTSMTQNAMLYASDPGADDQFGCSVAIESTKVVVGAMGDDSLTVRSGRISKITNHGSAYIFIRPSGWGGSGLHMTQSYKIAASDKSANDEFGCSVALSGDMLVVGAPGDDNYAGSAYVFIKDQNGWPAYENDKIIADDRAASDLFGESLDIDGNTVVVGARGDGINNNGATYVFIETNQTTTTTSVSQSSTTSTAEETSTTTTSDQAATTTTAADSTTTTSTGGSCQIDADCDNGVYCDGQEKCADTVCVSGQSPCAADKSCREEQQKCWDVATITAASLLKTLSKPLIWENKNHWLILYCSEDNHFDKQESSLAIAGSGNGYQGVNINTEKSAFRIGKFILIPVIVTKGATAGNWRITITTELPGFKLEERITADFQVR